MSQLSAGILGAIAASLTFGAVQLASGSDLGGIGAGVAADTSVNRIAKADRAQAVRTASNSSRTISVQLHGLSDTSVAVRIAVIPVGQSRNNDRNQTFDVGLSKSPALGRRATLACEPVVSVLTEVAKQLQPGRCVT